MALMLTGRLVRVRLVRDRVVPYFIDPHDPQLLGVAEQLLVMFRNVGQPTRGELEEELKERFGADPSQLVPQGLAKLLEDRCEFEVVSGHPPEQLRELVFEAAAKQRAEQWRQSHIPSAPGSAWDGGKTLSHPTFDRDAILHTIADPLELSPEQVEQGMFADLKSEQQLLRFEDISAERLLHRYNVSLAQAVLLRSTQVEVDIRNEPPRRYRQLFRKVKFHRLVCDAARIEDGYQLRLDGPMSLFTATQKYGLQLALFLPHLLHCQDFELTADVLWGTQRRPKQFRLTAKDGLVTDLPEDGMYLPTEVAMFAEMFRKKAKGWELTEETDLLPLGDSFWIPDFRLKHADTGRTVHLEILGFWRRASVEKHLERLREHAKTPFILAISDQLRVDDAELEGLPASIHRFRQMPQYDEVLKLAEGLAG
jgi:uncharacterized protein